MPALAPSWTSPTVCSFFVLLRSPCSIFPSGSSADSMQLNVIPAKYVALTFRAGTKVQGFEKRELSDPWVPAQLWVINEVEQGVYTIQNTNSRTFADLSGSMLMISSLTLSHSSI